MLYLYLIDKSDLYEGVFEEVSRVADEAYDGGVSLYDSIVLTERDRNLVERFIDDAASAMVRRMADVCKFVQETSGTPPTPTGRRKLQFNLPDADTTETDLTSALDRFLTVHATNAVLQERAANRVPEYTTRTQNAMDEFVSLARKRQAPSRT